MFWFSLSISLVSFVVILILSFQGYSGVYNCWLFLHFYFCPIMFLKQIHESSRTILEFLVPCWIRRLLGAYNYVFFIFNKDHFKYSPRDLLAFLRWNPLSSVMSERILGMILGYSPFSLILRFSSVHNFILMYILFPGS